MAIDTKNKRFSMLNFGDGTSIHLLPNPDGSIESGDRQHLLDCYSGIAFSEAVPSPILVRAKAIFPELKKKAIFSTPKKRTIFRDPKKKVTF